MAIPPFIPDSINYIHSDPSQPNVNKLVKKSIGLNDQEFKKTLSQIAGEKISILGALFKGKTITKDQAFNRKMIKQYFQNQVKATGDIAEKVKELKRQAVELNKEIKDIEKEMQRHPEVDMDTRPGRVSNAKIARTEVLQQLMKYKEALNKSLVNRDLLMKDTKQTFLEGSGTIKKLSKNIDKIDNSLRGLAKVDGWAGFEVRKVKNFIEVFHLHHALESMGGGRLNVQDIEKQAAILNKILKKSDQSDQEIVPLDSATRQEAINAYNNLIALALGEIKKQPEAEEAIKRMEVEAQKAWDRKPHYKH